MLAPRPVHEIPSLDVAIEFPPLEFPTATHNDNDLLHVTANAPYEKVLLPLLLLIHVIPSVDVATVFPELLADTATHIKPFQATPRAPCQSKMLVPRPIHVIPPSDDVAIEFPASPTATTNCDLLL